MINEVCIEEIGPDKAFEYLQKSGGNRELKKTLIARYTLLMKSGKWNIGDGVIIFNKNGKLQQGHHRLNAIIASGCTLKFIVRRGAEDKEVIAYDTGAIRTPSDAMAFDPETYKNCKDYYFPIVRMLITDGYCRHERDTSSTTLAEFINAHEEELDFVWRDCFREKKGTPRGVAQSSVLAVILSMVMHGEDQAKLKIAAQYLIDGDTTIIKSIPGYQSLTKLRDYLISGKVSSAGGAARLDVFSKTQNMLNLFMRGENRDQVRRCIGKYPYPCLDYVNMPKLEIDPQFQYHLIVISKHLSPGEKLTAKFIAERMIANGYKIPSAKDAVNTASKRISTIIRRQPCLVLDLGVGKLIGLKHGNRVSGYQFVPKDYDFGPDTELFNEAEFIERARQAQAS